MDLYTRLVLAIFMAMLSMSNANAADKKAYEVGESLQKGKAVKASPNAAYKHLEWEALSPTDWDPLEALNGLDLDKLDDADPKAIKALTAVGDAWKNAPIIPALSGQHVSMSGFVVPLDISKDKVIEFLLVPYFGACIHAPPPPSNQTLHAINAKVNNKQQNKHLKDAALIQGPITIIGVLETVSSQTAMGSAGYRIQIESIEAYKERVN